jgi:(S)-sulfolactate dehydrogenase
MPDIVISEFMDERGIREELAGFDVLYDPDPRGPPPASSTGPAGRRPRPHRAQPDAGARPRCSRRRPPSRRWGASASGLDNIDVEACRTRSVAVFPATGANDVAVAEYVIATAMSLLRGAYGATADVAAAPGRATGLMGREISGKRLGLVASAPSPRDRPSAAGGARHGRGAHDPFVPADQPARRRPGRGRGALDMPALLATSDGCPLHVPLTDDTPPPWSAEARGLMKPDASSINAARGGVVDDAALVEACGRDAWLGGPSTCFPTSRSSPPHGAPSGAP